MKQLDKFEYPEELKPDFEKAKRLEWITITYLISTAVVVYLTMGNSQAMKTAWFEDLLSLTPSVSFLIASHLFMKAPNRDFPYGYHRVVSIAYLCSALALFAAGVFLVIDSSMTLSKAEHPTIGIVVLFGYPVWLGYLMIAAMLWSTFPAIILGKKKLPLAKKLHEKNLFTDAEMNKADWMTASAAIVGILGIGIGWWWADAVAALIIAVDIVRDGFTNLKQAVFDLMDEVPKTVDDQKTDPLVDQVQATLAGLPWVKDARIRLREEGHIYLGEGFVIARQEENLTQLIESASREVQKLDWRIQEFVIMPVQQLPPE
ncbi:cation transporter [Nibrella saemangeumensis]|uniref:Cation transporter n=1 Tax=Nibrella saemangeumensis TaxID=1084526 RepID=A0ABP8MVG3_9BACT